MHGLAHHDRSRRLQCVDVVTAVVLPTKEFIIAFDMDVVLFDDENKTLLIIQHMWRVGMDIDIRAQELRFSSPRPFPKTAENTLSPIVNALPQSPIGLPPRPDHWPGRKNAERKVFDCLNLDGYSVKTVRPSRTVHCQRSIPLSSTEPSGVRCWHVHHVFCLQFQRRKNRFLWTTRMLRPLLLTTIRPTPRRLG